MAVVASVATWQPLEGKAQEFLAVAAKAKKIHERLGGKVRMWQSMFGGQPATFGYVIEHASWDDFGKFGAKMEKDGEWLTLVASAMSHPTARLVQNSLVSEAAGF